MKRLISYLIFVTSFITSIITIFTFTTTYNFYYVSQLFSSYLPMQIGICVTMAIVSVNFIVNETGKKRIIYSAVSLLISASLVFFIVNYIR
ncbi:hypothetical protein [Clostridium sp. BJN0001]|uniref:hypothetical protein n=1 Tax=Clostridium sp. BJN0001 TaxID=2930219 RepID=UPI001FD04B20|nr:hypothetical protein [Clostridium sp. BJN0001]